MAVNRDGNAVEDADLFLQHARPCNRDICSKLKSQSVQSTEMVLLDMRIERMPSLG